MEIINLIKDYWVLIVGILVPVLIFVRTFLNATVCSLRNDILIIYNQCDHGTITKWNYEAILHSAEIYFKLGGNSFIKSLIDKVKTYEIVD